MAVELTAWPNSCQRSDGIEDPIVEIYVDSQHESLCAGNDFEASTPPLGITPG